MAKDQQKKSVEEKIEASAFDASQYLPEGFGKEDFEAVGGLIPLVPASLSFEQRSPVLGWIVRVLDMPPRETKGGKEDWQTVHVHLLAPCKGIVGGEEIVDCKPGDHVLIPMSGSLRNNAGLMMAATDQEHVYIGLFTVTGQVDTGQPTPMWAYKVEIHKKNIKREGQYALLAAQQKPAHQLNGQADARA